MKRGWGFVFFLCFFCGVEEGRKEESGMLLFSVYLNILLLVLLEGCNAPLSHFIPSRGSFID